jgi:uncharacterized protein (DUF1778 family)
VIAVNIQITTEYKVRLIAAAEERQMSVEEFVVDAIDRALRPIENRRRGAARDVLELEALWRNESTELGEGETRDHG